MPGALSGFNVIGVTERLDDFLAALSARTGWHETLEGAWAEVIVAARNAQSYEGVHARWRQDALGAEEQAALAQHTACDAVVYRAAAALAQAPPHAALSTADVRPSMLPATPPPDEAEVATTPERRAAVLAALRARRREHAAAAMAHAPEGSLPRCALVVFYHVAKTGGSYVRFLMQASRAGGEWSFDEPEDFRNVTWPFLRDSVLARSNGTADGDSSACAPLWERGRLLAEVHANAVRPRGMPPVVTTSACSECQLVVTSTAGLCVVGAKRGARVADTTPTLRRMRLRADDRDSSQVRHTRCGHTFCGADPQNVQGASGGSRQRIPLLPAAADGRGRAAVVDLDC